jgi:putative transposase
MQVAKYFIDQDFCVNKILKFAEISSSNWYYHCKLKTTDQREFNQGRPCSNKSINIVGEIIDDNFIIEALKKYRQQKFLSNGGGVKKLRYYLRRDYGVIVNHKKLYRLCKEHNLLLPKRAKHTSIKNICINRIITRPNQVWEFDIKCDYLPGENRYFFILVYIDVFSRMIMDYYIGLSCKAHNLVATLSFALNKHSLREKDLVIRSDNGPQMTSNEFREYLKKLENKIFHEFIPCATPNKNAHIEAFYSIIEIEFLQIYCFETLVEVYKEFAKFVDFYNNFRVHSSLSYRTPKDVMDIYNAGGILTGIKKLKI